jgi:hypothetical protein
MPSRIKPPQAHNHLSRPRGATGGAVVRQKLQTRKCKNNLPALLTSNTVAPLSITIQPGTWFYSSEVVLISSY